MMYNIMSYLFRNVLLLLFRINVLYDQIVSKCITFNATVNVVANSFSKKISNLKIKDFRFFDLDFQKNILYIYVHLQIYFNEVALKTL